MNYIMILRKSIVYNRLFIILILHLRAACSINFEDFAVVVGGKYTSTTASVYNKDGWDYDLPSFNHARTYGHACGSFLDNNNHEVYSFALNICCQVFFTNVVIYRYWLLLEVEMIMILSYLLKALLWEIFHGQNCLLNFLIVSMEQGL